MPSGAWAHSPALTFLLRSLAPGESARERGGGLGAHTGSPLPPLPDGYLLSTLCVLCTDGLSHVPISRALTHRLCPKQGQHNFRGVTCQLCVVGDPEHQRLGAGRTGHPVPQRERPRPRWAVCRCPFSHVQVYAFPPGGSLRRMWAFGKRAVKLRHRLPDPRALTAARAGVFPGPLLQLAAWSPAGLENLS